MTLGQTMVSGVSEVGWSTFDSPTVGSLSVSPKFRIDGVDFEVELISTSGSDLVLWLTSPGFGQQGAGGLGQARLWVLYLDGEAYRFADAGDGLGLVAVEWADRAPGWSNGQSVAIRLARLPRSDPVLNSDGSETLWEAMVGVERQQALAGNDIGYLRIAKRGSADPDEFDWEGATYEVQQFDWVEIGSSWSLVFEIDGTRGLSARQLNRFKKGAYFDVVNPPDTATHVLRFSVFSIAGNVATFGIDVNAPTHSDGDDLDVKLILRHVPTAPREVSVAVDGSTATIRWIRPRRDGGAAVQDYFVERSDDGGGTWFTIRVIDAPTTTAIDSAVPEGPRPLYRVYADNLIGYSPYARESVPAVDRIDVVSTPPANNTYRFGEPIDVVATFSRAVWVQGVAELALRFDGETVKARYAHGAGSPKLTFRHLVGTRDFAGSIFVVSENALALDGDPDLGVAGGGAIHSVRGTSARLESPESFNLYPDQRVDGGSLFGDGESAWSAALTVGESPDGDVVGYARGGVGSDGRHGELTPDAFSHEGPDGRLCHHAVHSLHYRKDDNDDWWFVFEFTGLPDDPFERVGVLSWGDERFVLAEADRYERPSHTAAAWWRTEAPTDAAGDTPGVGLVLLNGPSEAPHLRDARALGAAVKLTWDPPTEHGSAAINGYRIEHATETAPDDWSTLVHDTFSTATERFVRVGLGTRASYRVRALGLRGAASEPSNEEFAATDAPEEEAAEQPGTDVWCGTLTSGSSEANNVRRVGYAPFLSVGGLEPDTFRHLGTHHTVVSIVEVPVSSLFAFLVHPALAGSAESWTLEVGGRRFGFGDATRVDNAEAQEWRWRRVAPSLVDGESVPVCLRSSVVPVKRDSALVPDGVGTGERYRLLFVTSNLARGAGAGTLDGGSFRIAEYNRAVRARAKAGSHKGNPIRPFANAFAALASTPGTDARDNAGTGGYALFTEGLPLLDALLTVGGDISTVLGYSPGTSRGALAPPSFTYDGEAYVVFSLYENPDSSCPGDTDLELHMNDEAQHLADLGAVLEIEDARFDLAGNARLAGPYTMVATWCDPGLDWTAGNIVRVRLRLPAPPETDTGVPVYWLNGANAWSLPEHPDERTPWVLAAEDYAELHGGFWTGGSAPRDEFGQKPCIEPPCRVHAATGSRADGTAEPGFEMGMERIRAGALNDLDAPGPLSADVLVARDGPIRVYGISPVLEVRATKPSIWGVRATDDRTNEIEVTWRLRDNGAPVFSLEVQHRIDGEWADATDELDADARSYLFEDLIHTSNRRYRVVAVNREGRTISGWVTGGTTGPTRPRIQFLRASTNLSNAIELSWSVRENGSPLTSLVVEEFDVGTTEWQDAWTAPTDPPSGSRLFENLGDGFRWTVRLRAVNDVGTTVGGEVQGATMIPFSAQFLFDTEPHGGAGTTFERLVEFDQGGSLDAADLCDVLKVTYGTCLSSRRGVTVNRFGDEYEAWPFTIAPDGDADVTLTLHAPPDCDAEGAVCSTDGRRLAETVTLTVPGPSGSMRDVPLTAEFVADSVPARHDGSDTAFTLQIRFNQDIDVEDLCAAVEVADGACTAAAHEAGDTALWDLTIVPDGGKPVTVALPETTDCDAEGAVCTADDGPLTTAISVTAQPPLLEASWESPPDTHNGGGTTYAARVRFSREVDVDDLCDAFKTTNGTCGSSSKVGGAADLWEISVEPDGAADLTLSLESTADCAAADAVCTADGNPLFHGVFAVVPRRPVTVALASLPDDHGGVDTTFTVQLRFSEAVDVDGLCHAFHLVGATCGGSAEDGDEAGLWDVVFAPDGAADAELALPGTADCAAADAVCAADGAPLSNGILELVPRRPFTAAWAEGSIPAAHRGAGTEFTVRVRFSEDAHVGHVALRDEALEVTNGTCTKFTRVDGRNDLREATIAPDGTADVSLLLDSPADCDASDAVCTKDDSPLTTVLELSVPGGGSQAGPLTAEFVAGSLPAYHGGADTTFAPRVRFNRDVDIDGLCAALTVTDGSCGASSRVGGDAALWEAAIAPDASKPVTVALPATADCDAAGAVCTSGDTPLSTAISATVAPPLEAAWESLPETHRGGGTTYAAQVRFGEEVDLADLCAAFETANGTCAGSAKVGDSADLWEISVEPDGASELTLSLESTADCAAADAVCTADGNPLFHGVFAVVPRRPVTVALASLPDDHGGVDTTFTVQLRFSEAVDVDGLCHAFHLVGATCGGSAEDGDEAGLWDVVFAPDGAADAELALPGTADCAAADAVCAADGAPLSNGILEPVPRRPFTAAWAEGSIPAAHRGAGTEFTVRVRFSEDAHVGHVALRDEALEVTNGTCARFTRVDGRHDLREATIAPDGTADVSLLLDSPADCDASDAVCTKDDSPLTTVLELSVPGGGSQAGPLTAEFVAGSLPAYHGGADTTFAPRVRFNRDVDIDGLCAALTVTDGSCGASSRVGGDAALWEAAIAPDASKPVTVALPATADCAAAGAVCTSGDTPLSTAISATVAPPLEAAWESLPDTHRGGGTTYAAQVRFGEEVDLADLCAAFETANGTCAGSAKVGDSADLWEISIEPDGASELTLSLESTADCAAADAVCTADGNPLFHGVFAVVPRRPVTVALASLPDDHGGVDTTFTVQLRFSEAVDVDGLCHAFHLVGATCGGSAEDGDEAGLWDVVFAPDGAADAELALPGTADCAAADAVCAADGAPLSNGFLEILPRRPFTAAWVEGSIPAAHRGAGTEFTVRVRFSEDAHVGHVALRDEALEVTNGTCTRFTRVDGRNDLREATIAPDGTADVSLLLDSPADCDASDAVCTKDDSPLTTVLELSVPGGGSQAGPLTAEFVAGSLPAYHGGADTTFAPRVRFNRDVDIDGLCAALTVTDGSCGASARVGGDAALWEAAIAPDASKPVTVALPATADCAAAGAVCTSGDTPLSTAISTTVAPPLEAAWESLPDTHRGGGTTYAAQVRFGEEVDLADLCAAFETTNGTCAGSAKVGDSADLWEISIEPDGASDLTLSLESATDCAAADAVCTADGKPLARRLSAAVPRVALTAEWAAGSWPDAHAGAGTRFTARIQFSEDAAVSYLALRDLALRVTDGDCRAARRVDGRDDLWEAEIEPRSGAAVTLELPATADCAAADAVCTADGSPLSAGIELTVPGPAPGGAVMNRPLREDEDPPRHRR